MITSLELRNLYFPDWRHPLTSCSCACNYKPCHEAEVKTAGKSGEAEQAEDVWRICMNVPFSTNGQFNIICSVTTFPLTCSVQASYFLSELNYFSQFKTFLSHLFLPFIVLLSYLNLSI